MKKYKTKNILSIIILIMVLLIFILMLYIVILKTNNYDGVGKLVEEYVEDKIVPVGSFKLNQVYDGKINDSEFYENLNQFEIFIRSLNKKINGNSFNIDKYYEKNISDLKKYFGNISLDEFEKIVNYLKIKGNKSDNFRYASIDTYSFENTLSYLKFKISLIYENESSLEFEVHYMKDINSTSVAEYYIY